MTHKLSQKKWNLILKAGSKSKTVCNNTDNTTTTTTTCKPIVECGPCKPCKTGKNMSSCKINQKDILNINKQNNCDINKTKTLLTNLNSSFSQFRDEVLLFQIKLTEFQNNVQTIIIDSSTLTVLNAQYFNLLTEFYNLLYNILKLEDINGCGISVQRMFLNDGTHITRDILLSYLTCSGVVINQTLCILDNISISLDSTILNITIGNTAFDIQALFTETELNNISDTLIPINDIIDTIVQILNKNINLSTEGLAILTVIQTNLENTSCC
jgi:hypothetical protein